MTATATADETTPTADTPQSGGSDASNTVVVIGSGLAGLASACTLAARGYRVICTDKNEWLGGKAAPLTLHAEPRPGFAGGDFRFDMGPTIQTMPKTFFRIFEEAGKDPEDYARLVKLDPQWRCFFDPAPGSPDSEAAVLDLRESVDDMEEVLKAFNPDAKVSEGYRDFVKYAEKLHEISERFYFYKPIGGIRDMMDVKSSFDIKTLKDVLSMRMGHSVAGTIRKYVSDERVCQMLDHYTQYVGSNPFGSPAILCSIASMQVNEGVWYPMGGTRAVPEAMIKLGTELGVDFRPSTEITKITYDDNAVTGVLTGGGETIECGAVVSNMDAVRTHRELIGGEIARAFDHKKEYEPACSGVVLYLGLSERYEHLAHHDFVFSRDAEEEFHHIYELGEPAPDPTCYLASTSQTEPGTAPEGGDALYVLVHTPFLRPHHDWSKDGELFKRYREVILDKLERTGGMHDIRSRIVCEAALTPQDIHDRYHVLNGAIYGVASHGKFFGAFKPSNRSKLLKGLYLAGGAAHPGPGMPMVLMSGWIAAAALDEDGVVAKR